MIRFLPLGAAKEIGASCFYLNLSGSGIILDCGMHPQKKGFEAIPDFSMLEREPIDYVLLSHAHQDHLSSLPFLIKKFPFIKILSTPQTRALAELVLHDSISILKKQPGSEDLEIYSHEEIDLLIKSIEYRTYNENFRLSCYKGTEDINATFYNSGHILGSAGILIQTPNHKLFYTGDINLSPQSLIQGAELPGEKVDTLIIESTYGSTDTSEVPEWEKETTRFAAEANKYLNKGGSILIPAFSLGKTQEMVSVIWKLMESGKIPLADIYTGGVASKISRVYDYNRYVVKIKNNFELASVPQKNLYEPENPDHFFRNICFVIASSGMMIEGTASFNLGLKWITRKDSAIFTVGYMEESTPGFKFSNAVKGDILYLKETREETVRCSIKKFRFPSHARREQLLQIVRALDPENVVLVHGEPESINWLGKEILKDKHKKRKVYAAEIGKEIILT
jgi:Cft2 family RNA processing exonuclease